MKTALFAWSGYAPTVEGPSVHLHVEYEYDPGELPTFDYGPGHDFDNPGEPPSIRVTDIRLDPDETQHGLTIDSYKLVDLILEDHHGL